MRVGLDIDGVLLNYEEHFLEYLNLPKHHPDRWDDPRFVNNFKLIEKDENFWLGIPRIFDPKYLYFIPEIYVTARPVSTEITRKSLISNGFPDRPIITVGHGGSKVEPLLGKVDIFVEDSFANYMELNKAGIRTILVTRSHNREEDVGHDRFKSLLDFQHKYGFNYENEIWLDIKNYENIYKVSNFGRIKSLSRRGKGTPNENIILSKRYQTSGYEMVTLCKNRIQKTYRLHRIVAEAFLGSQDSMEVNHIDGDILNNKIDNLEWVTPKENSEHAVKNKLYKGKNMKYSDELIKKIKLLKEEGVKQKDISQLYGISEGHLSYVLSGKYRDDVKI
ncbi:MAG: HNH endonuclease [Candidatus Riesia sp.]|nr:HNH endonuclease [Candidatus Riesia sp.]